MKLKIFPKTRISVVIIFLLVIILSLSNGPQDAVAITTEIPSVENSVIFIENVGQFDEEVLFQARVNNTNFWFTRDGYWVTFFKDPTSEEHQIEHSERSGKEIQSISIKVTFQNANQDLLLVPVQKLETNLNFFLGNDPKKWRENIPLWGGLTYQNIYPGIDLLIGSANGNLVQQLITTKNADINNLKLNIEGGNELRSDATYIFIDTLLGTYQLPLITVEDYKNNTITPLTIDETTITSPFSVVSDVPETIKVNEDETSLVYSTFLGGTGGGDIGAGIAVDLAGNGYITGYTNSFDFPNTTGEIHDVGYDAFVAKLNDNGSQLIYATFIGGNYHDYGRKIQVDENGIAYVVGATGSRDFPTTDGAYDTTFNADYTKSQTDAFVLTLNETGSSLGYSTFLGGKDAASGGNDIAIDGNGSAYITGITASSYFPSYNAFDPYFSLEGTGTDGFITKLNPDGSDLEYSSFLGGMQTDTSNGIAVNSLGEAFITGNTNSSDFPISENAFDQTLNDNETYSDCFVAKVSADGSSLIYATFIGGSLNDFSNSIAVNTIGEAYITGSTISNDYPTKPNGFDISYNGGINGDATIAIINNEGTDLVYSSFIGGSSDDKGNDIVLDRLGVAYITGYTQSIDFPTTPGSYDNSFNGTAYYDIFITKINLASNPLAYSSFIGGSYYDVGSGIAIHTSGQILITGHTQSNNFPVTPGAFDTSFNYNYNVFILKMLLGERNYIQGIIRDDKETPISGVAVFLSDGQITTTNAEGYYHFYVLEKSSYIITPYLLNFRFAPKIKSYNFSLISDQNFVIRPEKPEHFLDIPLNYPVNPGWTTQELFTYSIMGSNNGSAPGYINSFFDHTNPTYNQPDGQLITWNGKLLSSANNNISVTNCLLGSTCYDYHNGIDMRHTLETDETVYAAAAGIIVPSTSILGYGNSVLIDHQNGYATFYGHLASVSVNIEDVVIERQSIGIMGNTGPGSKGIHLHFGVYYDKNGDQDWDESEVVDPFGWDPVYDPGKTDPWSVDSFYLWEYSNKLECSVTSAGTTQKSPSGLLTMDIPVGAVSSDVTLNILDVPPAAKPSASLRFTGQSFFTQILEWLTVLNTSLENHQTSAESTSFTQPVTLSVKYDPSNLSHLDLNNLAIYFLNTNGEWEGLKSSIDPTNYIVTAQTLELGNFTLQAPLLCPDANQEPNDNYDASSFLLTDGTLQIDSFDIQDDEDWYRFQGFMSSEYLLRTTILAPGVDTVIEILDTDGVSIMAVNDNFGENLSSQLLWQPPQDGVYFIRVSQGADSLFGCQASYGIKIDEFSTVDAPILSLPEDGSVTNSATTVFSWDTVIGADHYEIQISKVSDFISTEQDLELTPEVTSYTSNPLDDGIHYWRVRAIDSLNNQGNWSDVRTLTIDTNPPNPPLLAVPVPGYKVRGIPVTFEWSGWKDEVSFIFQYDDNSDFSSPIFTSDELTTESCTPPFQQIGISYYWHVKARDEAGNWSDWSSKASLLIYPVIPSSPPLISPENRLFTKDNTPTLSWSDVTDGYKYKVQISKTEDFSAIVQKSSIISPQLNEYTALTLVDGKYYWRVKAINVDGEKGPWSETRKFTVDTVKPAAPILYKPADGKTISGVPTYRWLAISGAKKYILSYSTNSAFTENVYLSPLLTDLFFTPISQDPMTYYWRVRAIDKAGNISKWSAVRKVIIE